MTDIYIPPTAEVIPAHRVSKIRLGLQGAPGTGKTWSAMTFPNVIVADFDDNLNAHRGKPDIRSVRFHDKDFMLTYANGKFKSKEKGTPHNRRDALLHWLEHEGTKLMPGQTLVLDSWTSIQAAFDAQQVLEPKLTRGGQVDDFHFWGMKIDFCERVFELLKSLSCHVVVTIHEFQERDANGNIMSKLQPLMQGKFTLRLAGEFPDFYRCVAFEKLGENKKPIVKEDGKTKIIEYFWQTQSDNNFNGKCSIPGAPMYVGPSPSYEFFVKQ